MKKTKVPKSAPSELEKSKGRDEAEIRIRDALQTKSPVLTLNRLYLSELPPSIAQLTHLRTLDINYNQLTELPEWLGQLTKLRCIFAAGNELTELPKTLQECTSLKYLFLHGNKGLGLPPEVLGPTSLEVYLRGWSTVSPAAILAYYFRAREGSRPLNEAKLILVGRGGVGKTCLIKQLIDGTFDPRELETPGIEIRPWKVTVPDGDIVRLHVWDFGGQEILHATHQLFLTERTLYLLVLSGREGSSTQDAEYWLQLIKSFGGNSRVLIALNKSAQHPFDVNRGLLLEKYPFIADFVKTDCEDGRGVPELMRLIIDKTDAMEHRKVVFPADWFKIKEELAGMQESSISWDDYQEVCRDLGERNVQAQRDLARFLHILGIALNYSDDPRLRETHVLNPRWVTEGIYSLLRTGHQAHREGVLTSRDLADVLDAKRYPGTCHAFLLHLMEKFQLCFRLPGPPDQYLVPELLSENQPDLQKLLAAPGLDFRYQYEVLPEGLLPRFIVQTHMLSMANADWRWRSGVVLHRDGCQAIVRTDSHERRVSIHITGNEAQRRGLLAIIRERFAEQHRDLKGLTVEERVPVPGEPGVTVSYRHLLLLEEDGEVWCQPEGMRKKVLVADLLNGLESPAQRRKRRNREEEPQNVAVAASPTVFISYSHKDEKFLDELLVHLKPLERLGLTRWSDKQVMPGSQWFEEIRLALSVAKVAVMLVSPAFLASDFIHEHELGPLLKEAKEGGVRILWVPLRACAYNRTPLIDYQAVLPPDKPLAQMKAKRDAAWVRVGEEIEKALT